MKKITKAVIPAAGLGTRVLPASKAVPKEMLNIVDKPAIQYLVEECAAAGITDVLIITNRGKGAMEDHFDYAFELEASLKKNPDKKTLYDAVHDVANLANIFFVRQKETAGLAHAIAAAEPFTGDEPFAVLYGDDIINAKVPVIKQLMDAYEKYGTCVTGVNEVPMELLVKYCSLEVNPVEGRIMQVGSIKEKPDPDKIYSKYAILGRNVLTAEVYDYIRNQPADPRNGEVMFSEALGKMALDGKLYAVDFEGKRYDMGNKLGIMQANCEFALEHPEIGEAFRKYIKELAATL